MTILKHILGVLAVGSIAYSLLMLAYSGVKTAFLPFWLFLGVISSVGFFIVREFCYRDITVPNSVRILLLTVCVVLLGWFVLLEYHILRCGYQVPTKEADYMIVLGAQVRGRKLTKSLKYRLDVAIDYAKEHKNIILIVSGGQGSGEDVTEAEAMKEYLCKAGIAKEHILCEEQSTNTYENIKYSQKLMKRNGKSSIIVTNRFHLYRAIRIAKKQGVKAQGLGAKSDPILTLSYYIREFFAVIKDQMVGNL